MVKRRTAFLVILGCSFLLAGIFIFASGRYYKTGYPLDDAWIHQTFARNLATRGEWAINPGEPTAGSTSPLWTFLLAIGYLLHIPHQVWTYGLGIICLAVIGWFALKWLERDKKEVPWIVVLLSLLVISDWHLVWASVSGMEILLQAAVILWFFYELDQLDPRWYLIGLLAAVSVWIRPDGITLFGPALLVFLMGWRKWKEKSRVILTFILPVLVLLGGYLYFNYRLSGTIWPNTLAAKQMEYASLQDINIFIRYIQLLFIPFVGVGIFLIPGTIVWAIQAINRKVTSRIAVLLWILGWIFIYAWKLPVTYQHGRYLMPVIPVLLVISLDGIRSIQWFDEKIRWHFILSRSCQLVLAITPIAFLVLGAQAYCKDVAIIETDMVQTAQWVAVHTQPDDVIAAHDIGAMGYFSNRKILDLAGLINPEIIPYLRDSNQISEYIREKKPDYLVIYTLWYQPALSFDGVLVYQASAHSIEQSMAVYQLKK
jgi:hypothetical protein